MTIENLNDDEIIIDDKIDSYFSTKTPVHITLKKIDYKSNKNIFLNGTLTGRITNKVWGLEERKLGAIRISISEIKSIEEDRR
jgi:hypothetical protein